MKRVLGILAAAVLLTACNNPAGSAAAASATPAYAKGVITAKGSVWVNGVEYHTENSTVSVDGTAQGDAALRVGMTVELRAVFDPATGRWKASHVDYESELKGVVTNVDPGDSSFMLNGVAVTTDSTTVFEGTTGLTGLAALTEPFVEVSGTADANGNIAATRVEVKASEPSYKVTAVVSSDVTTTTSGGSFTVVYKNQATFTVTYEGTLDPAVVQGSRVRITFVASDLNLTVNTVTTTAAQIQLRSTEPRPRSGDHSEVHGVVSDYAAGDPVTFNLDSQKVSVSAAVLGATTIQDGDRIEVEGSIGAEGVLTAKKIHFDRAESEMHEVTGTVGSIDTIAGTFTLTTKADPLTFSVNDRTIFHGDEWIGTDPLANLAVDAPIEVKYYIDGRVNVAVKIDAEDGGSGKD